MIVAVVTPLFVPAGVPPLVVAFVPAGVPPVVVAFVPAGVPPLVAAFVPAGVPPLVAIVSVRAAETDAAVIVTLFVMVTDVPVDPEFSS